MESSQYRTEGTVLLPSDYIAKGGWCTHALTLPKARKETDVGVVRRGKQTPDGMTFCINGAVSAAYQDGCLTEEQAFRYLDVLDKRIKRKPLLVILRPFCALTDWLFAPRNGVPQNGLIESTSVVVYNDYLCGSREEAESLMREVEHEMGLRPVASPETAEPSVIPDVSGVRNNVARQREALMVQSEQASVPEESQRVDV